jgi:hypothetical protein
VVFQLPSVALVTWLVRGLVPMLVQVVGDAPAP